MDLKESRQLRWADENCESMESSSIDDSGDQTTELSDDANSFSSPSSSSSSPSCGPLYELADLMAQLPIKRGLSKYYDGKSRSFACLASVGSVEDLAKKEISCYSKRMKSCKSYGANLNNRHKFGPRPTIAKRSPKTPFSPSKGAMLVN
ncbi:uncharacterized protein LOC105162036 [Sesamum indicum]|uniref:Uncharacterized protein LOC105162036 n=1 Tax=Sesamum indicum TaxID=4182 RepID=A0A6I9TCD4_SESIN|nr:uncharacterized protein LOC105162036 [Sesamum indicum]